MWRDTRVVLAALSGWPSSEIPNGIMKMIAFANSQCRAIVAPENDS